MFREAIKMTYGRINELGDELKQLKQTHTEEQQEKEKELEHARQAVEALLKIQAGYDREQGNLAIQRRACPFPDECNKRDSCTAKSCNADVCNNGFAFRMS